MKKLAVLVVLLVAMCGLRAETKPVADLIVLAKAHRPELRATWVWRDYDREKTEQKFAVDPAEKDRRYSWVGIVSRE